MNWWENDPVADSAPINMAKATADWWSNDPVAEPKQESWGEWLSNSIKGRQDPNFSNAGTVFDQFKGELGNTTATAANLGASDDQMADVIQKALGDKFIRREQDANGYDVFVTRGPDGKEQRGYVNKPGLDSQDVTRGIRGALPYALTGGGAVLAGAGRGLLSNMALQGAAGWTTSAGGDVALQSLGSEQGIEGPKGAAAAAFGAAGPVVGKIAGGLYQRFIAEPRFYNRATGELTQAGIEAAQRLGMDPQTMAKQARATFAKTYAASPEEASKMVDSGQLDFNVPQTLGQRTKDPEQLMVEKAMRSGTYGAGAKERINGLFDEQAAAINSAVREAMPRTMMRDTAQRVARKMPQEWDAAIDQKFAGQAFDPGEFGSVMQDTMLGAKNAAKTAESAAWGQIGIMRPTPQALEKIPDTMRGALGDMVPDQSLHPTTWRMLETLDSYAKGDAMTGGLDILGPNNGVAIDAMRKRLLGMSQSAMNNADAKMAGRLYGGFNDWIGEAAQNQLLLGNVEDAARLVAARDVTKEMKSIFEPTTKGRATPAGRIIEQVLKQDTPERIVDAIFSGPRAGIKDGSLEAIRLMKQAAKKYAGAAERIDIIGSLKTAHWSKIVQGKDGQLLENKVMLNNLRTALTAQRTLVNELYSPAERQMMTRIMKMLEGVTYKDPNPSGTATGVAVLTKQLFGRLMSAFGPIGQTALEYSGLPRAYGSALARRATAQAYPSVPVRGPNVAPLLSAVGAGTDRLQQR